VRQLGQTAKLNFPDEDISVPPVSSGEERKRKGSTSKVPAKRGRQDAQQHGSEEQQHGSEEQQEVQEVQQQQQQEQQQQEQQQEVQEVQQQQQQQQEQQLGSLTLQQLLVEAAQLATSLSVRRVC
jgi:hypothetical protein